MGEFKPRNPDIDLLYRGEKSISDSIKRNTKAIKNIDLSEVNVEVNTDNISDAILESATVNKDALEGVAGTIQNVQRFIDYSEKLEEIVNAISALNYGEELQIEINEVEDIIEQIIEDFQKLKSDYEETTEETLDDITTLNENYNNLLLNFTNLTETVNSIIEKIGDIPTDISEEFEEIKESVEELKQKITEIEEKIDNINNIGFYKETIKNNLFLGLLDFRDYVKVPCGDYVCVIKFKIETDLFRTDDVKQVTVSGYLCPDNATMLPIIAQKIEDDGNGNGINILLYFDCIESLTSTYVDVDFTFYITYLKGE